MAPPSGDSHTPPGRTSPERVARSAGIVSLAVFSSRITGLIREQFMAAMFGAGMENDAFSLGFRIPNLTRDLFAEGALSSAFVPTFTEYLQQRGKDQAIRLANLVATALILIVGVVCLLGVIFAPQLVDFIATGFHATPGKYELAVRMTRIMFPFLLLVALAAQAMGILNACNVFGVPATASTFFNIGSVSAGYLLGFAFGPALGISRIEGMAWGVVFGGGLQLLWQVPSLLHQGFRFRPRFDLSDPGFRRIVSLMGPAIIGSAAVQINVVVNTDFASEIVDKVRGSNGAVSWLNYAFRFMQLPLGIFGVAIASATLPAVSRAAARGDFEDFRKTLSRSMSMVFLLTIPSAVGLAVLGRAIIGAIYQARRFELYDTEQTAIALSYYAIGLAGYSAIKVITPAFYTLGDTRIPMLVSLISIVVNYLVSGVMTRKFGLGHAGLALSTSAVSTVGFVILFWSMRNRINGIYGRDLMRTAMQTSLAAAFMGVIVWALNGWFEQNVGMNRSAYLLNLVVTIPVGIALYYGFCRWLNVRELEVAVNTIAGPIMRRLKRFNGK